MPQLQTSYVKTLNDKQSLRNVRLLAVDGLKEIAPYVSRLDSLITELHNGIKKNDDASVRYVIWCLLVMQWAQLSALPGINALAFSLQACSFTSGRA